MRDTPATPPDGAVAVVLKGYPRLSETFVAQELQGLEAAGMSLRLYSLRHPTDAARHPVHDAIEAPVVYLPEYLHRERGRVWRAWRRTRRLPGYRAARRAFGKDYKRDRSRNRVRRFGQALVLAAEMPADIRHIYAHFLHTPASVARYAAMIRGLGWSCSAHAKDIWTTPEWEKQEKLDAADWTVTCTRVGAEHLSELATKPDAVQLVYHGLDMSQMPAAKYAPAREVSADTPLRILSVGRLVEKKGYDVLLDALARLPDDLPWKFTHIGRWDLKPALTERADALGLSPQIDWLGPKARKDVFAAYENADLFVLASKIADDGDRDGLPNVLMEAMSFSVPCIATHVSGIPELIQHGRTGLLAPPDDADTLASLIEQLAGNPSLRQTLGEAGSAHVRANFAFDGGLRRLLRLFGHPADSVPATEPMAAE